MNTVRRGEFIVELSGVDVAWETYRPRERPAEPTDRKLYCRVCGLEASVSGGSGWPACCGEPLRSATTREQIPRLAVV